MASIHSLRPGVYTRLEYLKSPDRPTSRGIAVAALAGSGMPADVKPVYTLQDIAVYGSGSALYQMAKVLLDAGVSPVWTIPANSGYEQALAAAASVPGISITLADADPEALLHHVEYCRQYGSDRIGVIGIAGIQDALDAAKKANSPYLVICVDGSSDPDLAAAAFAACIATHVPTQGFSGMELPLENLPQGALTAEQVETLIAGGVTAFEQLGSKVQCIRAVTSQTLFEGQPDRSFSSLSTVLAADEVMNAVRQTAKARMKGMRNNEAARSALASQLMVTLEEKRISGLIDSYQPPLVQLDPDDPEACTAIITFRTAPEVSQIVLSAAIQF